MTQDNTELPPAGWHQDPAGSDQERYWDGTTWTEQLRTPEAPLADATATQEFFAEAESLTGPVDPFAPQAPTIGQPMAAGPYLPQAPMPPAQSMPQAPHAPQGTQGEAGFFRSLFDLSFAPERVVTIKFSRVLYLLATIMSILGWIVGALVWFIIAGIADEGVFAVFGILQLLFGWILPLLAIVGFRVGLEVMIAVIRTSQHTAPLLRQGMQPNSAPRAQ